LRQSQRKPAILEGELPEAPETRASAIGCLGIAASSPTRSLELGQDRWPPQQLRNCDRNIANCNWLWQMRRSLLVRAERCRAEVVIPPPRGDKLEQESTYKCGPDGWSGPHLLFLHVVILLEFRVLFAYTGISKYF